MNMRQTYLQQFLEAVRFYTELFDDAPAALDLLEIEAAIRRNQSAELAEEYRKLRLFAASFGADYIARYPGEVARACHAVSAGFFETWNTLPFGPTFPLAVTIGNVYYRGENLYEVTRESLARIIHEGSNVNTTVNVHVWLTLDDMTVIDPTIVSTLLAKGTILADAPPVLVWREGEPSDFRFEPVLTDNQFFGRVDTGLFLST